MKSKLVKSEVQTITVAEDEAISVDPAQATAGATLRGEDHPSDNPDDLLRPPGPRSDLRRAQRRRDSSTPSGGKLPPKSAIREVRINQNPFSAEYDRLGFDGSKSSPSPVPTASEASPFGFGDQVLNSRNPFARRAPYQTRNFGGTIGGLSKRSSFCSTSSGVERARMLSSTRHLDTSLTTWL